MSTGRRPALYTFIDEGGNFEFSAKGTPYFTITSVTCARPFPLDAALTELRFDLLEQGTEIEYFHATEDLQSTRDSVFALIQSQLPRFRVDSVIVEKRKTAPAMREWDRFYPEMLGYLLQYLVNGTYWPQWSELVVITDRIPHNKRRAAVEKAVKTSLARMLPKGFPYRVLHYESKSSYGLQIADYFNWAIYVAWTRKEMRPLTQVQGAIKSQFPIFQHGTIDWY